MRSDGRANEAAGHPEQRSVALTGSASRAGKGRRAVQAALGALSWVGFALLWMWQLEVYVPSTWLYSICLIAIILAAWIVLTICWVRWNRNIYARRHRRNTPVRQEVSFDQDTLGRPIKAPGGIRAAEGQIMVSVDGDGNKRYESARLPRLPGNGQAPAAAPVAVNGNGEVNGNGHHPEEVPSGSWRWTGDRHHQGGLRRLVVPGPDGLPRALSRGHRRLLDRGRRLLL